MRLRTRQVLTTISGEKYNSTIADAAGTCKGGGWSGGVARLPSGMFPNGIDRALYSELYRMAWRLPVN